MVRRCFTIPAGTRLVSAVPDLDWDGLFSDLKAKREAREQELTRQMGPNEQTQT